MSEMCLNVGVLAGALGLAVSVNEPVRLDRSLCCLPCSALFALADLQRAVMLGFSFLLKECYKIDISPQRIRPLAQRTGPKYGAIYSTDNKKQEVDKTSN